MLQEKYFNYLVCTSKDVDKLVEGVAGTPAQLNLRNQLENSAERSESSTPTGQVMNETLQNAEGTDAIDTGSDFKKQVNP